jgi:dipeptidyl aminopeptidase/acylaminoacyl peptidase
MTNRIELTSPEVRPLIPRAHLFGVAAQRNLTISRDGNWLAWMAPLEGVANIWLAPRERPSEARVVTFESERAPGPPMFAQDDRHILFLKDANGDENTQLFALDMETGETRNLTPEPGVRCGVVAASADVPGHILVRMNARDVRFHDIFSIEIATGARVLVEKNDAGYSSYVADTTHALRFARLGRDDGGAVLRRRASDGEWENWLEIDAEDANTTSVSHLDATAETLLAYDSRGRDTAALVAIDLASGVATPIAEHSRADIDGMILDPATLLPLAWAGGYGRRRYHPLGDALAANIAHIDAAGIGDWMPTAMTRDLRFWIVAASSDTRPGVLWIYDRETQRLEALFETRPQLAGELLARMHPIVIRARDGLEMCAYLTLPPAADRTEFEGHPRTRAPLPLVIIVHGGPATRDRFGFDGEAQWLANRGYAVLKVNYRGSAGFGKAFQAAGDLQWGLAMSDDIDDAVDWAVSAGIGDPARLAIKGGSYGGYAVLVALTRSPEKYACGIDLVGPSNLETLIETIPPYWASIRKAWLRSVGDPDTREGRASLRARSPIHCAGDIARPLLIGHGANDPRVKQAEADQMVSAMVANRIPVTYALFGDEGHGFGKPANAICFAGLEEAFLAQCIGGAVEPLTASERAASSMEIRAGGEWLGALNVATAF